MSAFMVSQDHLDAIISLALWGPSAGQGTGSHHWHRPRWFAVPPTAAMDLHTIQQISRTIDQHNPDQVGQMLCDANMRSLRARYDDADASGMIPDWASAYHYRASLFAVRPSPVEGLKLIACYRYQASECPDWRDAEAASFCDSLEHALIACLPGYDRAPWEWRRKQQG